MSTDGGDTSMVSRLTSVVANQDYPWALCLFGEDQPSKLAQLSADLVVSGDNAGGKHIESGFSYWGIEPTVAWIKACKDPMYPVMKRSIDTFPERWRKISTRLPGEAVHYVSLGPGDGEKDCAVLRTLRSTGALRSYIPIDISADMLQFAIRAPLQQGIIERDEIIAIQLDFSDPESLTQLGRLLHDVAGDDPLLMALLGNTLSNFADYRATLSGLVELMRPQDQFALELAVTTAHDEEAARLAAREYERSSAFRSFVTSSLIHYTDIAVDRDDVEFLGSAEEDDCLLVRINFRNNSPEPILFGLADGTRGVKLRAGEPIQLLQTRKFLRRAIDPLVADCGLLQIHSAQSTFSRHRLSPPFGMDLLLLGLDPGPAHESRSKVAEALWNQSGS